MKSTIKILTILMILVFVSACTGTKTIPTKALEQNVVSEETQDVESTAKTAEIAAESEAVLLEEEQTEVIQESIEDEPVQEDVNNMVSQPSSSVTSDDTECDECQYEDRWGNCQNYECCENTHCKETESCEENECEEIGCDEGYYAMNHECLESFCTTDADCQEYVQYASEGHGVKCDVASSGRNVCMEFILPNCETDEDCDDDDVSTRDFCQGKNTPSNTNLCKNMEIVLCWTGDNYCPENCTIADDEDC